MFVFELLVHYVKEYLTMTDIDLCTSGDCMSTPFLLWIAIDILFVLIAAMLVVYGEVISGFVTLF